MTFGGLYYHTPSSVMCVSITVNPIVGFIVGLLLYPVYRKCKNEK